MRSGLESRVLTYQLHTRENTLVIMINLSQQHDPGHVVEHAKFNPGVIHAIILIHATIYMYYPIDAQFEIDAQCTM